MIYYKATYHFTTSLTTTSISYAYVAAFAIFAKLVFLLDQLESPVRFFAKSMVLFKKQNEKYLN